jgi:hypothetical protein
LVGVEYYFVCKVTDTGNGNATANSSQLGVQLLTYPSPSPSQNQFVQTINLGALDQAMSPNTQAVIFDPGASGTLVAGQAVKVSTTTSSSGNVPMVTASTSLSDVVFGFVAYDFKTAVYNPGDRLQIASAMNVIYLAATSAITQGTPVYSAPSGTTLGGVGVVIGAASGSAYPNVGYAYTSIAANTLGRVFLTCPALGATQAAVVEANATATATDLPSAEALANSLQTSVNAILTSLKAAGLMGS